MTKLVTASNAPQVRQAQPHCSTITEEGMCILDSLPVTHLDSSQLFNAHFNAVKLPYCLPSLGTYLLTFSNQSISSCILKQHHQIYFCQQQL